MLVRILFFCCLISFAQAETAYVAVASNFTAPMKKMAAVFEEETGHQLILSFGSSGKFFAQINHGAPFDLFFSADQHKPRALQEKGLIIEDSRKTYAIGALALWSKDSSLQEDLLSTLHSNRFNRLALANPLLAPYGAAAVEVLDKLQLRKATETKWVRGENIAQTYQFVSTGNAELGFVALSQIMCDGKTPQGAAWPVPSHLHQPIKQDMVLLKRGGNNPAALALIAFIDSNTAQAIIESYGYSTAFEPQ